MAATFKLSDLGEGLREAEIVAWHVSIGDHVVADQPLVAVETDKAIVEVPSPSSGTVAALHGQIGDVIAVGAPLVELETGRGADTGAIVGDIDTAPLPAPRASAAPVVHDAGHIRAAPAIRKLAASLRVDLAEVAGTGPQGTISSTDVEAAAAALHGDIEKLRGVRRSMFRNMTLSGNSVVPATVTDEADIDAWEDSEDVTPRLIRAMAVACRVSPALNAWFDATIETRTLHERIDLGIAVETADGLFAPVLHDAGSLDPDALRLELENIKTGIENRLAPRDSFVGATITLSNFGLFGGRFAELVVVPPQVAILGAGRAEARAVAEAGQAVVRRRLPLSLTFDHRVVTGIEATRFINAVIDDLQRPA